MDILDKWGTGVPGLPTNGANATYTVSGGKRATHAQVGSSFIAEHLQGRKVRLVGSGYLDGDGHAYLIAGQDRFGVWLAEETTDPAQPAYRLLEWEVVPRYTFMVVKQKRAETTPEPSPEPSPEAASATATTADTFLGAALDKIGRVVAEAQERAIEQTIARTVQEALAKMPPAVAPMLPVSPPVIMPMEPFAILRTDRDADAFAKALIEHLQTVGEPAAKILRDWMANVSNQLRRPDLAEVYGAALDTYTSTPNPKQQPTPVMPTETPTSTPTLGAVEGLGEVQLSDRRGERAEDLTQEDLTRRYPLAPGYSWDAALASVNAAITRGEAPSTDPQTVVQMANAYFAAHPYATPSDWKQRLDEWTTATEAATVTPEPPAEPEATPAGSRFWVKPEAMVARLQEQGVKGDGHAIWIGRWLKSAAAKQATPEQLAYIQTTLDAYNEGDDLPTPAEVAAETDDLPIRRKTLREWRWERSISATDVARKVGLSSAAVYLWEQGKHTPSATQQSLIADLFGLRVEDFEWDQEAVSRVYHAHQG